MKKEYSKPAMLVVELRHKCQLLTGSKVSTLSTNSGLKYAGASKDDDDDYDDEIIR